MKVGELLEILKDCDPNTEMNILFPLPTCPHAWGNLKPIHSVKPIVDQDTNTINYYIDTGVGKKGRFQAYIA